jgi:hypothetical protein
MKRDEFIDLVINKLKSNGYETVEHCLIEDALHFMEEAGIVPPAIKVPCATHYIDSNGIVQQGEDSFVFIHRWEDEDG